ncbi:hypothetical protein BH18THE2_BH18THE2_14280 [soil metagenome]
MGLFIKRHTCSHGKSQTNYSLSNIRNTKTVTEDDIDSLLELAELYNTAMILNQQNVLGNIN